MHTGKIIGGVIGIIGAILLLYALLISLNALSLSWEYIFNWIYYMAIVVLAIIGCLIAWISGKKISGILLIIAAAMAIVIALVWYTSNAWMAPWSILAIWYFPLHSWPITVESLIILAGGLVCLFTEAK